MLVGATMVPRALSTPPRTKEALDSPAPDEGAPRATFFLPHPPLPPSPAPDGSSRGGAEREDDALPAPAVIPADEYLAPPRDISRPRAVAGAYWRARSNAFTDEEAFLAAASQERSLVADLQGELSRTDALVMLPAEVQFLRDAPPEIVERMQMLDLLGGLAEESPDALDALVEIALVPIDHDLPPQAIRALVGEKYDALVELARIDWPTAASTFERLDGQVLQRLLRPALISGLERAGKDREDAIRLAESL